MKTVFKIVYLIGAIIVGLILACAFMLIFTPIHIIAYLYVGHNIERWAEDWTKLLNMLSDLIQKID